MKNNLIKLKPRRHLQVGSVFHLTFAAHNNEPIFSGFSMARIMVSCLRKSDKQGITDTLAFVVMPDHVHWLFVLKFSIIPQCIQRVRAQFSRTAGGSLLAAGYRSQELVLGGDLVGMTKHVVENPLRVGLVEALGDYPYWYVADSGSGVESGAAAPSYPSIMKESTCE